MTTTTAVQPLAHVDPAQDPTGRLDVFCTTDCHGPAGTQPARIMVGHTVPLGGAPAFDATVPGGGMHTFDPGMFLPGPPATDDRTGLARLTGEACRLLAQLGLDVWFEHYTREPVRLVALGHVEVPACVNGASVLVPAEQRCTGRARYGTACPTCGTVNRELADAEVPF